MIQNKRRQCMILLILFVGTMGQIYANSFYQLNMNSDNTLKNKLNENARHLRFISRAEMFQRNRKNQDQLDYFKFYTPEAKNIITSSLTAPIPSPLPPLSPSSISYYRRSQTPVFQTRLTPEQLDGHMTYQSLWILAALQQKNFQNYSLISKQFQRDFQLYLSANSTDIREMAIIAAGNKILGKQKQIIQVVSNDPKQLWVLANHVYEKKISFRKLFAFLNGENLIAFQTLYQLSNNRDDQSLTELANNSEALEAIGKGLQSKNQDIRRFSVRLLGNLAAEQDQYFGLIHELQLLDRLFLLFQNCSPLLKRDACWLLSNLSCQKNSATKIIRHKSLITKLVELFYYQEVTELKRQITHIFAYLAHFGQKKQAFVLLAHQNLLEICYKQLIKQDNELNIVTLFLLNELIDLGDNCRDQDDRNIFCMLIATNPDLRSEISKKSYSQNNEISSYKEEEDN